MKPLYYFVYIWLYFFPLLGHTNTAANQASYDFNYALRGDKRVAPVQVFDDGLNTYLQFRPGQLIPAIFSGTASAELIPFELHGPYVLVPGRFPELKLQLNGILAQIVYTGSQTNRSSSPLPELTSELAPSISQASSSSQADISKVKPTETYELMVSDLTLRNGLERWAKNDGWVFNVDHWTLPVDIPISAHAQFVGDFKTAVRALLRSTELSSYPMQPCFYSNRVLRVVALAERCDRSRSLQ